MSTQQKRPKRIFLKLQLCKIRNFCIDNICLEKNTLVIVKQKSYLIISCYEMFSPSGFVEVRVHRNRFDWTIQADHLVIFATVEATDDHLETYVN